MKVKKAETYKLFKTWAMLLSATSRKGQPDADLHTVQNPQHALISNKQEGPVRSYFLFKTQSMLLLVTSKMGQPDADLHTV